MQVRFRVAGLCLLLPLLATAAFTQTITASLHGRVSDKSGAVLPQATVTVANTETGLTRSAVADDRGEYEITQLPWALTKSRLRRPVSIADRLLATGDRPNRDPGFFPFAGRRERRSYRHTEVALVETTRTSVDSVIGEYQIQNLPVNGRQFIDFALLARELLWGIPHRKHRRDH